jgi:hypothetical protein
MSTEDTKLVARIQHFYDYMCGRKEEIEDSIMMKSPETIKHLNEAYDDLKEEYTDVFKEFLYQK